MASMASITTPLPSILNFRDVGATVNQVSETKLQKRRLYRSARPDKATIQDKKRLVEEFGIKTIIDLRTDTELAQVAPKHAISLKIPGITYREINFNGNAYRDSLLKKLTWWQYGRLAGNFAVGRRVAAIRVLGENVMTQRGLVGLALDSVDACVKEVKEVFDVLGDESAWPVLVHCTQGKDRTGLCVLLLLCLVGVGVDAVEYDYMLSQTELEPEKEERLTEIESIGLTAEFADCDAQLVKQVIKHIDIRYGGVEQYLCGACGVDAPCLERCKRAFATTPI